MTPSKLISALFAAVLLSGSAGGAETPRPDFSLKGAANAAIAQTEAAANGAVDTTGNTANSVKPSVSAGANASAGTAR